MIRYDHISSSISLSEVADNEFAKYRFGTNGYKKCTYLCSGDFNGDNKQDMLAIMSRSDDRNWYFYLSKGNGRFSEKITFQMEQPNYDLCENIIPTMADFNDDGFTDLDVLYKEIDTIYESALKNLVALRDETETVNNGMHHVKYVGDRYVELNENGEYEDKIDYTKTFEYFHDNVKGELYAYENGVMATDKMEIEEGGKDYELFTKLTEANNFDFVVLPNTTITVKNFKKS